MATRYLLSYRATYCLVRHVLLVTMTQQQAVSIRRKHLVQEHLSILLEREEDQVDISADECSVLCICKTTCWEITRRTHSLHRGKAGKCRYRSSDTASLVTKQSSASLPLVSTRHRKPYKRKQSFDERLIRTCENHEAPYQPQNPRSVSCRKHSRLISAFHTCSGDETL